MRSRCFGSMLAWILKTKPVNGASAGCTMRAPPSRGCGGGAHSTSACRISRTPKLLMPEPKNTGRLRAGEEGGDVEGVAGALDQLDVLAQAAHLQREEFVELRVVEALDEFGFAAGVLLARLEAHQLLVQQVPDAAEGLAHAERPGDRRAVDLQHRLDLLEQLDRLAHLAVELVHEGDDRRVAQAADFEQLDGLRFDALGGVDHHDGGVDGGEHAVGVLGEVLVARRVEQVDGVAAVVELHHRAGDRDAALLLHLHPVGGGVARALARLHRAGHQDGAAEQQQLLGQRGLAGVGVGNDGEGAPLLHVAQQVGGEGRGVHVRLWENKSRRPVGQAARERCEL
jgi:hypothetical protein